MKDLNKSNWQLDNLELLCYNCYFLYVGDLFNRKQLNYLEDAGAAIVAKNEIDWELDEYYTEHLRDLGLITKEKDIGSEFINYR